VPYVPVVDISADPDVVGAELDEICRTAGFFQITGHGIADDVAEPAWTMATKFFDLPLADKMSVARPTPDYPYGHIPLAGESLSQSMADAAPPELRGTAFGMFNLIAGLALLVASVIAGALWDVAGPQGTFLAGAAFTILTLIGLGPVRRRLSYAPITLGQRNAYFWRPSKGR